MWPLFIHINSSVGNHLFGMDRWQIVLWFHICYLFLFAVRSTTMTRPILRQIKQLQLVVTMVAVVPAPVCITRHRVSLLHNKHMQCKILERSRIKVTKWCRNSSIRNANSNSIPLMLHRHLSLSLRLYPSHQRKRLMRATIRLARTRVIWITMMVVVNKMLQLDYLIVLSITCRSFRCFQ